MKFARLPADIKAKGACMKSSVLIRIRTFANGAAFIAGRAMYKNRLSRAAFDATAEACARMGKRVSPNYCSGMVRHELSRDLVASHVPAYSRAEKMFFAVALTSTAFAGAWGLLPTVLAFSTLLPVLAHMHYKAIAPDQLNWRRRCNEMQRLNGQPTAFVFLKKHHKIGAFHLAFGMALLTYSLTKGYLFYSIPGSSFEQFSNGLLIGGVMANGIESFRKQGVTNYLTLIDKEGFCSANIPDLAIIAGFLLSIAQETLH